MPKMTVQNLQEGMILDEAVYDRKGRLILAKGLELEENHLRALKTWGISTVQVHDGQDKLSMEQSSLSKKQQLNIVKEYQNLFQLTNQKSPFIQELFKICVERKMIKKSGGVPK